MRMDGENGDFIPRADPWKKTEEGAVVKMFTVTWAAYLTRSFDPNINHAIQ